MARVVLDGVTKTFHVGGGEVRAVSQVSLDVQSGEFLAIIGPSGSGKTTLLRVIAGLEEPTSGSVSIDGKPMTGVVPGDRDIAMVFQSAALYPHLTAFQNIGLGLRIRGTRKKQVEQRVHDAANLLGLHDCLHREPFRLSAGQRQRVALARAIVRKPRLFLFDEPLANLDTVSRVALRHEVARLRRHLAATVIYVTHDQVEAMTLGDRVAVINGGILQQVATPRAIYENPANMLVAGFIGSPPMNLLEGVIAGDDFVESGNGFKVQLAAIHLKKLSGFAGARVVLGLRPEHVELCASQPRQPQAHIELIEWTGADTYVHVRTAVHPLIAKSTPATNWRVGDQIGLRLNMDAAHFFDPITGLAII